MTQPPRFDYLLVGAGLANGLIALELLRRRPEARVALLEQATSLGGNHTWSFHEQDVLRSQHGAIEPLVAARWKDHDVAFPGLRRRLRGGYASVFSYDLDRELRRAFARRPDCELLVSTQVLRVASRSVELASGRVIEAEAVLDGRGPDSKAAHRGGYQKFVGLELGLKSAAPRQRPLLMDAQVPQLDGLRFVYVLPFAPKRVLIEDTYYSASPTLQRSVVRERILGYAKQEGYEVDTVLREEVGVLPIPTQSAAGRDSEGPIVVGFRGGWFHPTTGYSFPIAARVAHFVAEHAPVDLYGEKLRALRREHERQARFARFLNTLLFGAFAPTERFHVLERFYGLPEETIARFYALRTTTRDRLRILCGRPPRGFSLMHLFAGDASA